MKTAHWAARPAALALALVLLLSACAGNPSGGQSQDGAQTPDASGDTAGTDSAGDGVFTLYCDSGTAFNPFENDGAYNAAVMSLVYEGLFRLDSGFQPQPVLCTRYTANAAYTEYELTLADGVTFHNGEALTAADATASLNAARASSVYAHRLRNVAEVTALSDLTLKITLSTANANLPALLDMAIVPAGSAGASMPAGTGRYAFSSGELLTRFSGYRTAELIGPDTIQLTPGGSVRSMMNAFSAGTADLLVCDRTGTQEMNIHTRCDTYNYGTTQLQFIGFNTGSALFSGAQVRQAAAALVDQAAIAAAMKGGASAAEAFFPEDLWFYDAAWTVDTQPDEQSGSSETDTGKAEGSGETDTAGTEGSGKAGSGSGADGAGSKTGAAAPVPAFSAASGLRDADGDGWVDLPDGTPAKAVFIVADTNSYRVAAARTVAAALNGAGLRTDLQVLSWNDYTAALNTRSFDLYYAETRLTPDFDPAALIGTDGSLNYGGYADDAMDALISRYLTSIGDAQAVAAGALCSALRENAPIVPVVYKKMTVYARRGQITGLQPTSSGVFSDLPAISIVPN